MSARCCRCYRIVLLLCENLHLGPPTRHGLSEGRGVAHFPPTWQAGWYVFVSLVCFGRVGYFCVFRWKPMAAAMTCHGSHRGIPRQPTWYSTGDHGRPWQLLWEPTAACGTLREDRGMPWQLPPWDVPFVIPRAPVGVPVASPTELTWEPTRQPTWQPMAAHVRAHVGAHMVAR